MSQDNEEVVTFRRRPAKIICDDDDDGDNCSSESPPKDLVASASPKSVRSSVGARTTPGAPPTKRIAVSKDSSITSTIRSSPTNTDVSSRHALSTAAERRIGSAAAYCVAGNDASNSKSSVVNGENNIRQKASVPAGSNTATPKPPSSTTGNINTTNRSGGKQSANGRITTSPPITSSGSSSGSDSSSSSSSDERSASPSTSRRVARPRRSASGSSSSSGRSDNSSSSSGDTSTSSSDSSSDEPARGTTAITSRSGERAPRASPAAKKEAVKRKPRQGKTQQSTDSDSSSDSDSSRGGGGSSRPPPDPKTELISQILSRWWYCLPEWPPSDFDYATKLAELGLRQVDLEDWEDLDNVNTDGFTKVYQVSHFPGVFRDPTGKAIDIRPTENKPSFNEMNRRTTDELQQLYVTAVTNQLADLKNSPFVNTEEHWLKKSEAKLKKVLNVAQRDLEKMKRRKEYLKSRGDA